ncbi:hypothetical protein ABXS75_12160 [Roseburia hominis]
MEKQHVKTAELSRKWSEILFIGALGGSIYYLLEIAFRGFSHWSMFVLGGLALLFCTMQGQLMHWSEPLWLQILRAVLFVTALEFATGVIVNKWLHLAVWDYSDQPLNLWGQICVPFMILFSGLIAIAIPIGSGAAYLLYREEKPRYFII